MTALVATCSEFLDAVATGGDITINKPAGVESGDLLLWHGCVFFNTPAVAPGALTGFTDDVATYGTTLQKCRVQHRIADGSEGASFTSAVGSSDYSDAIMLRIIGADQTTPMDGTPATAAGSAGSANLPAYTTTVDGCVAFAFCIGPGIIPFDIGGGWIPVETYGSPDTASQCWMKHMPAAGSTGTQNVNFSPASGDYAMAVAAVRPAPNAGIRLIGIRGQVQTQTTQTANAVDMAAAGAITVGNTLIVRIACNNTGTLGVSSLTSVSDPRSNTPTLTQATQDPGAADAGITVGLAYIPVVNAYTNGDDITVNFSPTTTSKAIVIEEWAGIHPVTPVAVAATTQTAATTAATVARTPTAAGQLFYVAMAIEGRAIDAFSYDSDNTAGAWAYLGRLATANATAASNALVHGAAKVVTSNTAQTWNSTITSRDIAVVGVVFDRAPFPTHRNVLVAPTVAVHQSYNW